MIDSSWYRRDDSLPTHVSAGGVVVRWEGQTLLLAMVAERAGSVDYVLPKGHVEPGEAIEAAGRREIMEEAGLGELTLLADLGARERLDYAKTHWKITHYFLYLTGQAVGCPTDRGHPYRLHWVPIAERLPLFWPEQRELVTENMDLICRLAAASHRVDG
jgi:8-oxo-dGTP pyrophosphatase MutT (NUDIX family)